MWAYYVEKHLGGQYQVQILNEKLSSEEAEDLENRWMGLYGGSLVNWVNFARIDDLASIDRYWERRRENEALSKQARELEKVDPCRAAEMYIAALNALDSYANIEFYGGLVGQLLGQLKLERGSCGDIGLIDRLTLVLVKLQRFDEAAAASSSYFEKYRGDLSKAAATKVVNRVKRYRT